jgi:hypothetical protein
MTEPFEQSTTGPSCFVEVLDEEYLRIRNKMMRYNFRYHLSKYPADLVRLWWDHERCLLWPTSQLAFEAYKSGKKPGHLYKGPPWKAKFAVIDGGKSLIAGKTSTWHHS